MDLLTLEIPGTQPGSSVEIQAPPGIPTGSQFSLGFLATRFLEVAMVIGILLSLFYLIYGGIYWIQSKGNKETLDKARRIIVYAIVGLIVMSLSLVIVNIIGNALGVTTLIGN
jgi:hypothetical protein